MIRDVFTGDDADLRSCEQRLEDQRRVRRQVVNLARRRRDDAFRRELLAFLQRRRAGREELVQFEVIPSPGGFETLVAAGELLVRTEVVDHSGARGLLERSGFPGQDAVEELEGRVARLVNRDIDARRVDDVARLLRQQGFSVSANHVSALAPVAKGLGGPEPSEGALALSDEQPASTSQATVVAVIDTGITDQRRSDRWLENVAREDDNIDALDQLPHTDGFLDFGAGHGTFAAGVIQQLAPNAEIRVYRALDTDGLGSDVDVAWAMITAARQGAHILNLSVGMETIDDQPPLAIEVALDVIGDLETQRGEDMLIVAAAGNFASTRPCWPAAFRRVVSVAGLTADHQPSEWSSRGFWVDCSTVGEGVMSTYVEGKESTELDPQPDAFPADAWALWTGSSFAAPQIAGAVARIRDQRGLTPRGALRELLRDRRRLPGFGLAVPLLPGS